MSGQSNGQTAVVCAACGGDPRASARCSQCGGAGIGVPSPDGFLVWTEPVDSVHRKLRRFRHATTTAFHLFVFVLILLCTAGLVYGIATRPFIVDALDPAFWTRGSWYVTAFAVGLLLVCFLIFRLRRYGHEEREIPASGMTRLEQEAHDAAMEGRVKHRFDVAPYYSREARDIVESAWKITSDLRRTQVMPDMVFAATLTSPTGGLLMARMGLDFERVKHDLALHMAGRSPAGGPPITLSRDTKRVLALAYANARAHRKSFVGPTELFVQSFAVAPELQELMNRHGFPPEHVLAVGNWIRLHDTLREDHRRFVRLAALRPKSGINRAMTAQQAPLLDQYSEDLTIAAQRGLLFPLIGRTAEMKAVFQAIESGSSAVVLVGEAGVGKTALVEGLARRMVEEDVPPQLFDKRLVSVNLAELLSGEGAAQSERLVAMLNEVRRAQNIILILEGIEALSGGAGRLAGPMDLAETLNAELERGGLFVVGTATPAAWTEFLERRGLGATLVKVTVSPLGAEETLTVLMARTAVIEHTQKVFFSYAALERAVAFSARYLHEVAAPQNAIRVVQEAAVAARQARGEGTFVSAEDVASVVHTKTQIPVEAVSESETQKLLDMEVQLHERIIGQDEAVTAVAQALRRARAEVREGTKPIASFLFLGPTGVGKTELSKALADEYFGDEDMMIRVDMSEYQDKSSVDRMIGRPGDERGGLLTEAVRKQPFALILLDEVEKAHPDILNLFLQVLDDGRLTDAIGRTVDFTNTIIIMTSNAGTPYIQAEITKGTALAAIRTTLLERELRGTFRPEFLNRFDGIIVFAPLSTEDVIRIAYLQMKAIEARLGEKGMKFRAEDEAVRQLAKAGFDPLYGARPLKRVIQERVDNQLADLLLRNLVKRGDTVVLQADGSLRVE